MTVLLARKQYSGVRVCVLYMATLSLHFARGSQISGGKVASDQTLRGHRYLWCSLAQKGFILSISRFLNYWTPLSSAVPNLCV